MKLTLFLLLTFLTLNSSDAQVRLRVRVDSGTSNTSCTDVLGAPERHWRVDVANQGSTTYPEAGMCFTNPPNVQYDETFNCPTDYPNAVSVCFRAFENDGIYDGISCIVLQSCLEETCQNYSTPLPGASATYTLTIPNSGGNASWGSVTFTIWATGSWPGLGNDLICDAINLGTLSSGGSLGNSALSNYNNFCTGNAGDPNPWGGGNEQGVWFQFTTGPNPASVIDFDANSDPAGAVDGTDLQLALYESSNGTCTGTMTLIQEDYQGEGILWDEDMEVSCLSPNTTYFLLVDGEELLIPGGGR